MTPNDEAASRGRATTAYYEDIATELERIAEMLRERPGLNHDAVERLLRIARDIRLDVSRVVAAGSEGKERSGS
jgi:hypothetical protein